jgi:hypothetical protein
MRLNDLKKFADFKHSSSPALAKPGWQASNCFKKVSRFAAFPGSQIIAFENL